MKPVAKILLITLLLLVIYQTFLWLFPAPPRLITNEERVEDFIYSQRPYNAAMVGSSLAARLDRTTWAEGNIYDLAMPFTNANTGLYLLLKTSKVPRKIFIEVNAINYGIDTMLMKDVFDEPEYAINKWFPVFRKVNKFFPNLLGRLHAPVTTFSNTPVSEDFFYKMLPEYKTRWMEIGDTSYINDQFRSVLNMALQLEKEGAAINLFEMPMDHRITDNKLMQYHRSYFKQAADLYGFTFIPLDSSQSYQTTDGLHLTTDDAHKYAAYLFRISQESR